MKRKHALLYILLILPLILAIVYIVVQGSRIPVPEATGQMIEKNTEASSAFHWKQPLPILLLQILVIIAVAKGFGFIFQRFGQQSVIGEIVAGIFLGPSILGWLAPSAFQLLFPESSLSALHILSQVGLVLFMFIIGMEVDFDVLKKSAMQALIVSHVSIVLPFFLGVLLAFELFIDFAPQGIPFTAFALFMGIAMSITAFPVLARILKERRMTRTHVGSMAIICAAIGDVTGWLLLVFVIAIAKSTGFDTTGKTVMFTALFVFAAFFLLRPLLRKLSLRFYNKGTLRNPFIAFTFLVLFLCAFVSEAIGMHALFGAFTAGLIMPHDVSLRKLFAERLEDVSLFLLLPLFFAFTGIHTELGLLSNQSLWGICIVIIALAVAGKLIGTSVAAKMLGENWRDSLSLGALMNTRGLMELIVLNIGLELGILSPTMFTMLVFMAIVTTLMTGPLLNLIEKFFPKT